MNTTKNTLNTRFAPETRYDLTPAPAAPVHVIRETEFERFKERLLRAALDSTAEIGLYAPLRRAANEAAAVAWLTPFPQFFLPALFEEKAAAARRQLRRQKSIRARSREIYTATA
jgi:hypothetical protein